MRNIVTALTIATLTFGAAEALAKGNGGEDQRQKLRAELAEARAKNGNSESSGGGFFSSLFGGGEEKSKDKDTTKSSN